jgi:hypothetical protein
MSIRILVVDDEPNFVETMVKRFTFRKMPVQAAKSGIEALRLLEAEAFDVVILDVRMPGKDGIRDPQRDQEALSAHRGDHAHRARLGGIGHARHVAGGLRLRAQARGFRGTPGKGAQGPERKQLNEGRRAPE